MPGAEDFSPVGAVQPALDENGDRVLENRYTDFESSGGGGSSVAAIPSPYPPAADPGFRMAPNDHPLRRALDMVTGQAANAHLRLALVDLTNGVNSPVYAGYRDTEQTMIASMGKLAMMVSAFALREAVRGAALAITGLTAKKFYARLAKDWRREFARGFKNKKGVADTVPNLPQILELDQAKPSGPFSVDFTLTRYANDVSVDGFWEHMTSAVKGSYDDSAAFCIGQLGFPYINQVMKSVGLFNSTGLWLSTDFVNRIWDPAQSGSNTAGTARSIADLFTRLAQDRLVAPGLLDEYRRVMADEDGGAASSIANGIKIKLAAGELKTLRYLSKVGHHADGHGDAVWLRRTSAKGQSLAYVAVALGGKNSEEITQAGVALDDCILLAHGEAIKPPGSP